MTAERALTVPISVEAFVSAVELSAGSGYGSFRAAFLAERLCFANLTLSFLEVLIFSRWWNKEPSEYTVYLGPPMKQRTVSAHCRSPSVWILDGCHVIGFITEMCRTRNRYLLRRTPIVSVATDSHAIRNWGPRSSALAGAPGAAQKSGLGPLFGGPRYRPAPTHAARPKLWASEQRAGEGHQGAPKKRLGLYGVMRMKASPAKSEASWRKIGLVGCDGRKFARNVVLLGSKG